MGYFLFFAQYFRSKRHTHMGKICDFVGDVKLCFVQTLWDSISIRHFCMHRIMKNENFPE